MTTATALRRQLDREGVPQVAEGESYPEGLSYKWVEAPRIPGPLRLTTRTGTRRIVVCIDDEGRVDQMLFFHA